VLRIKCNGTRPKAIRAPALRRANTGVLRKPRRRNYVHGRTTTEETLTLCERSVFVDGCGRADWRSGSMQAWPVR
jgi:hypothetical protein